MENFERAQFSVKVGTLGEVEINLSMNAFRLLKSKFEIPLAKISEFVDSDPLESLCAIAYCGAMNAKAIKGEKFEEDFDFFCALLLNEEDSLQAISRGIEAAFPDSEGGEPSGNVLGPQKAPK